MRRLQRVVLVAGALGMLAVAITAPRVHIVDGTHLSASDQSGLAKVLDTRTTGLRLLAVFCATLLVFVAAGRSGTGPSAAFGDHGRSAGPPAVGVAGGEPGPERPKSGARAEHESSAPESQAAALVWTPGRLIAVTWTGATAVLLLASLAPSLIQSEVGGHEMARHRQSAPSPDSRLDLDSLWAAGERAGAPEPLRAGPGAPALQFDQDSMATDFGSLRVERPFAGVSGVPSALTSVGVGPSSARWLTLFRASEVTVAIDTATEVHDGAGMGAASFRFHNARPERLDDSTTFVTSVELRILDCEARRYKLVGAEFYSDDGVIVAAVPEPPSVSNVAWYAPPPGSRADLTLIRACAVLKGRAPTERIGSAPR